MTVVQTLAIDLRRKKKKRYDRIVDKQEPVEVYGIVHMARIIAR